MSSALLEAILRAPGAPWRALDRHVARWLEAHGGTPLVALAGLAAAAAEAAGSACVHLPMLAARPVAGAGTPAWPDWPRWQAALIASEWVDADRGDSARPLVLRAGDCYLRRNYDHETRLITAIRARLRPPPTVAAGDRRSDLDALFGASPAALDEQRLAAATALGTGLFVLTGGPGTGKTSTVLRLLLLWLRQRGAGAGRIALAAPTGKAAQRLGETLTRGLPPLRARLPAEPWAPLLDTIAALRPQTLHALLGARPDLDAYTAGPGAPLTADLLVVDEASMVDLALMRRTLEALRPEAGLILLGDAEQLASVEAGSVLADLVAAAETGANGVPTIAAAGRSAASGAAMAGVTSAAAPLAGHVLRLRTAWRASGALLDLAAAIRTGDAARVRALTADPAHAQILHAATLADAAALARALRDAIDPPHGAGLFDDLLQAASPEAALTALRGARVLTALRSGAFGQRTINHQIDILLRRRFGLDSEDPWYAGRPLLITVGERSLGLVNGDFGVVHAGDDGLPRAWFEDPGSPEPRAMAPLALPAHETAYAMTVHKSQGSEFERVLLILPSLPGRGLSRELLYTGATRARSRIDLWAGVGVLEAALDTPMQRASRLAERLRTDADDSAGR
ncbi:MAG: exodeoxyribonuclease V subunit alpha [Xanthomonadaceae bacterium]|nr:exodeoxyribonuclease V subunit alpha [Xanthomonadaceae bacterium]